MAVRVGANRQVTDICPDRSSPEVPALERIRGLQNARPMGKPASVWGRLRERCRSRKCLHDRRTGVMNPRGIADVVRGRFHGGLGSRNVRVGRGTVISNTTFSSGVTIADYVRLIGQPRITLGQDVYINCFTMILGEISIERNALISQFVNIWGRSHRYQSKDLLIWDQHGTHGVTDQGYDVAPVRIGEGAWIGPHVTVLRGVTIGAGAVVGANSVVTRDIPAYAVCWGNPAKVVRFRG